MSLPYPHERNDCESCRERDADVHVLGEEFNQPGKRPLLLCQNCLGQWAASRVYLQDGGEATITLEPAPTRDWRRPASPGGNR